jgi:hypothetical protein
VELVQAEATEVTVPVEVPVQVVAPLQAEQVEAVEQMELVEQTEAAEQVEVAVHQVQQVQPDKVDLGVLLEQPVQVVQVV